MAKVSTMEFDHILDGPSSSTKQFQNDFESRGAVFSLFYCGFNVDVLVKFTNHVYKVTDGSHEKSNYLTLIFAATIIIGFISSFVQSVPSFRYFHKL